MTEEKLIRAVEKFEGMKIGVVGDILFDKYVYGIIERINPEKPGVPLLKIETEEVRLGGAGNVAMNVSSLGAKAFFYCKSGNDSYAPILEFICTKYGIKIFNVNDGKSIVKERFIEQEHNYYAFRADYGEASLCAIDETCSKKLYSEIEKTLLDALILSDYNKGMFWGDFGQRLIGLAKEKEIPVIVDMKPANARSFKFATLVCPNLKEAKEITNMKDSNIRALAEKIKKEIESDYVIVTCGKRGMACYDGRSYNEIPTKARSVADVTGAGDTARAAMALGLVGRLNLLEIVHLANYAAGIVVEKPGTATITKQELIERIKGDGFSEDLK